MGRVISTALRFIDGFTRPSSDAIRNMQRMGREFQKTGRQIQNAGKSISNIGSSFTKSITLPVAGIATAAVKMGNDFKNSMAKVSTIADTSKVSMGQLENQVKKLSNTTGVGVSDIAEAQYQAISAGVKTASSVKIVSTAVKAAKGGFTDAATAVDGLSTVINAYGLKTKDATKISDQMLTTQNFGKTSFGELASSMGKVIPIASSLNVSTDELFGSIAVLTKNGIATSEAVTGMKAAYSNILKPSSEAAEAAKKMGLNFSSAHLQSVGWAKFLDEIKEKTNGNTQEMAKLFGSTEALNSVTVLAGKGSADFAKSLEEMKKAGGATQRAYEAMLTPAERMKISVNKLKNSLLQFGSALESVFSEVADIIGAVGDRLNSLSKTQVKNIVKWAGIAAAIGPAIAVFGKMVTTVGTVTRTFGKISTTIGNFGGVLKMLTSPAGIVIGVLAGIALAAVLIVKNWGKVKGFLIDVGGWFADAFKKAGVSVQDFKNKFASIGNSLSAIFGKISDIVSKIGKVFIQGFAGDTATGTKKADSSMKTLAVTTLKAFNGIVTGVDKALKTFSALLSFFTGAFSGNWHSAAETFRHSLYNIFPPDVADKFVKVFNKALPAIKVVVAGIKGAFKGLVQVLKGLFGNIKTVFDGLVQFVSGVFSGNWKQALKGLVTIAEGVFGGLVNIIKAPFKIIGNVIKNAVNSFEGLSVVKTIFNSLGKVILKVMGKCGIDVEKFTQKIQTIKTRITAILGVLKGVFSAAFSTIGKVVKTASIVIAAIFGKKISSTCSTAKAAVTAFKAVAVTGFKLFKNVVKTVMAFVVPAVAGAFGALVGYISAGINNIVNIIDGIVRVCKGIIKFVTGVFTGNWKTAWQGVVDIFGGIFDTLAALIKAPINAVIGIINGAISGISKLGIDVPDWVPVIGGQKFGINIPPIPMLYKGTNNWQGGAAIIHDRGGEIVDLPKGSRVYPHDKSIEMARREGAGSGITINIQKLADKIEVRSDEDIDRIAEALAYKLKKVALNTGMA